MSSTRSLPDPSTDSRPDPTTRAEHALRLYEERGSLIRAVAADTYEVPSCGFRGKRYIVRYGGRVESCTCKDFEFGYICKHLLAVGIMHAAGRSGVREVRTMAAVAGDPFKAAGMARPDLNHESPHGCYSGWVYMGWEDSETGEEELERVPCRRCHGETA